MKVFCISDLWSSGVLPWVIAGCMKILVKSSLLLLILSTGFLYSEPDSLYWRDIPRSDAITHKIVISGKIEVIPLKEYKHGFNYYINPESFIVSSPYKPVGLNS